MNDHQSYDCPRCQIGICQAQEATYTRLHEGQLISVPSILRYTCDVCGWREVDPEALHNLFNLLGGKTPARKNAGLPVKR